MTFDFRQSVSTWRTGSKARMGRHLLQARPMPRLEHATQTNSDRSVCQSGKLNEIMNSRRDLKISHLLRFKPQVPRDGPESPHVYNISWHNFFCKAGNREICCRLRIVILFSIANLRMRLLRLFLCSLKEESRRIKNMRKKRKACFSFVACSARSVHASRRVQISVQRMA